MGKARQTLDIRGCRRILPLLQESDHPDVDPDQRQSFPSLNTGYCYLYQTDSAPADPREYAQFDRLVELRVSTGAPAETGSPKRTLSWTAIRGHLRFLGPLH